MNILGIMIGTNSTAALLQDGIVTACASEERFRRKKNTGVYPDKAIEYCLNQGGLGPPDIQVVVFDSIKFAYEHWVVDRYGTFSVQDWIKEQHEYWKPILYDGKKTDYFEIFKDKIIPENYTPEIINEFLKRGRDIRPSLVRNQLGNDIREIRNVTHYEAHLLLFLLIVPFGVISPNNLHQQDRHVKYLKKMHLSLYREG